MKVDIRVYAVLDPARCRGRPLGEMAEAAARGGATLLQYREKSGSTRSLIEAASEIGRALAPFSVPLLINDRIFIFEYESLIQDMVSGTILYTAYRNRVDILTGVQCTLAGRRSREPAAGKVIVEFLGRQIDVRRALRNCGLFAHDSDEVAASIRQRLDNHIAPDAFVLLASEQ